MRIRRLSILTLAGLIVAASAIPAQPQGQQPRPGGRFGFRGGSLFDNESVQKELKLSDEQKSKLEKASTAAREKYQDETRKAFQDRDFAKTRELGQKVAAEVTEEAKKVLSADQMKRYEQIRVQLLGFRAFLNEDVQKKLKLTDKQISEVKEVDEDLSKDREELMRAGRGDFAKMRENMEKLRKITEESQQKLVESLSAEQKEAWKDLTGEKFELRRPERRPGSDQPRRPGGRRPGGNDQPRRNDL